MEDSAPNNAPNPWVRGHGQPAPSKALGLPSIARECGRKAFQIKWKPVSGMELEHRKLVWVREFHADRREAWTIIPCPTVTSRNIYSALLSAYLTALTSLFRMLEVYPWSPGLEFWEVLRHLEALGSESRLTDSSPRLGMEVASLLQALCNKTRPCEGPDKRPMLKVAHPHLVLTASHGVRNKSDEPRESHRKRP
ncbi:hypothetical protein H8959_004942 [Pygathrix nigripes]